MPKQLDAVQVTASRVVREGFEAPTPTTVVDRDALEAAGNLNIADTINELPSVRPSMTQTSTTNNSNFTGGNFLDLRGLGFRRALVLVDGRRFTPTHVEGAVDMNMIPQGMVDKVEVVTGGASAAWGSDAVAGVANLILDHDFLGIRGVVEGGISAQGDRKNERLSLTWGKGFANDRGHVIVSLDAHHDEGIQRMKARHWGGWTKIANPAYTETNDEPRQLLIQNGRSSVMSYGGLINSGPLAGTAFDADGNPYQFNYGDLLTASTMRGGDGSLGIENLPMQAPAERRVAYARAAFDFTDSTNAFVEASWGRSKGVSPSLVRSESNITILRDNPFIPESVAHRMDELGLASIRMGRYSRDYGQSMTDRSTTVKRLAAGLEGFLGDNWSWDAYYTMGETELMVYNRGHRITPHYNFARDVTTDPVTGEAVCRSAEARTQGCMPLNLFGEHQMSQASLDYVLADAWKNTKLRQQAAAFTLSGDVYELSAGIVSLAAGVEWRRDSVNLMTDELSQAAAFASGNGVPFDGEQSVKELFAETVIPLLSDARMARSLDINLAARLTDYSLSGTVSTWKAGFSWNVNEFLRLRAAQSRDIRAPSLNDMFSLGSTSLLTVFDPELNLRYSVQNISSGNRDLLPEEADSLTFGVVVTPSEKLGFSLDYYDVRMDNALITLAAADTVERCYSTHPQVCGLLTRNPDTGRIASVQVSPQNLEQLHLRGTDLEVTWRPEISFGDLILRALVSYIDTLTLDDGLTVSEMAGQTTQPTVSALGGQPYWRGNLSARWSFGQWHFNAAARHVGGGKIDHTWTHKDLNILEHSGRTYLDIGGSYDLSRDTGQNVTLFASIKNLADKDPPINGVGGYGTTRALYDVVGRQYVAGVRFRF
ncbi:MAG: TonB-dependent receptor [Pseudoxanthomonas suwonensis]|nr:TonB-dependent receptor [Pseudoxanthomonas suwonensis]